MKLSKLLKNCPKQFAETEILNITDDSRKVENGSLFICVKGPVSDGHDFADKALENGAALVVCERDLGISNQIVLEDTHAALAEICANWFNNPQNKLKIIGVTGTNGKTSVCYMLKNILEYVGNKVGLIGTIQNMVGEEILPAKNTTPGVFELYSLFAKMVDAGCS